MKLYSDSKVYILCPSNSASGGPEVCHQLCSEMIKLGIEAYICYIKKMDEPVHTNYKKYHLPYVFKPEDLPHNICIVPEVYSGHFSLWKNVQKVFWWLSVDNYLNNIRSHIRFWSTAPTSRPKPKFFIFEKKDEDMVHFVQSEYARQFIKINDVPDDKIYMVEDYVSQAFLSQAAQIDLSKKENFVVYNPKKGFNITQQLIEVASDIDWRPIENMTPEQVQELLAKAKVYIDFGHHPGKDRIPREAAISGCVVITGKRGSAANDIDINIPVEFKFDDNKLNKQKVVEKIREVFENFKTAHEKQSAYRNRILDDKNRFINEIAVAFGMNKKLRMEIALAQGLNTESFSLIEKLQRESNTPSFLVDDMLSTPESILIIAKLNKNLIFREKNLNYLRVGENLIEIITRDDAKFLYQEGRIKKFALLSPTDAELNELKNFYAASEEDVLILDVMS